MTLYNIAILFQFLSSSTNLQSIQRSALCLYNQTFCQKTDSNILNHSSITKLACLTVHSKTTQSLSQHKVTLTHSIKEGNFLHGWSPSQASQSRALMPTVRICPSFFPQLIIDSVRYPFGCQLYCMT